ncbi:MAG: hypothetical protein IH606_05390 [Burkholderiales bacterium]|nr:hypothetical protein [Burkholderiales bacterium]
MTNDTNQEVANERSPGQPIAMRLLIEDPVVGWRRFPVKKAMIAYRGNRQLEELRGQTVRVVVALVIMNGRKIHDIFRLEPSVWKLDSQGRVDREAKLRRRLYQLNSEPNRAPETESVTPQLSDADVNAIRR